MTFSRGRVEESKLYSSKKLYILAHYVLHIVLHIINQNISLHALHKSLCSIGTDFFRIRDLVIMTYLLKKRETIFPNSRLLLYRSTLIYTEFNPAFSHII